MKKVKSYLICWLAALSLWNPLYAQDSNCTNLNFELGDFTNWEGYTWVYSTLDTSKNTPKVKGIITPRQTIMTDISARDENTGYELKKIPPGYKYSARLGIESNSATYFRCLEQSLRYTMYIDSGNALLVVKFALVLEYATDHAATNEPRFRFTLFNYAGDTIPDCSNYDVYSSNNNVKGFQEFTTLRGMVQWRDWTTVGINLSKYIGQTIVIEFMTADCTKAYHYGYAYFVADCHPLTIDVINCANDTIAKLKAPEGFESYRWMNRNGTIIDTKQFHMVVNPQADSSLSCTMTSATGCAVTLQSALAKYIPKADFSSYIIDCNSNTVHFTNLSTKTLGTLLYKWDFENGFTFKVKNPQFTFAASGLHLVRLVLKNPPSTCVDTIIKEVESFSAPLVGIAGDSTYCPGQNMFLKAYGAIDYTWSNGLKTDSIQVSVPGGKYWLIGRSSSGCVSDTNYITVVEEPDWEFLTSGDTTLCGTDSSVLTVSGAANYIWSTSDISNSITVKTSRIYTVTGSNRRGCKKSKTFNVVEYSLPFVDFSISDSVLDKWHNQIICNIPAQTDVQYLWNLGDGSTETGSTIQHSYNISYSKLSYTISLLATIKNSCVDSVSRIIDVIPFVPNVFSPNGDRINDVFMSGLEIQVYDRNGLLLYKGTAGWDGTYNGQRVDEDTYFYMIGYTDRKQQKHNKKGYFTLVR
jgi:gliding motility-associated-like protein